MGSRAKKYLFASALLAALTLAGCPKKESPEDIEFAAQQARKAAQEKKKKVDVFDEFYVDDTKKTATGDSKSKGKAEAPAPATAAAAPATAAAKQQSALPASSGSQNFSKNGRYVVQVNSTASEAEANRMAGKLKGLGYPAYVAAVQNPTPALTGTYFRVRLGGFDSYSEAKSFAEGTLASAGYDYWVDRKANDNVGIQGSGFGSSGGQQQYQPAPAPQPAARPQQPPPPPQQYQPAPQPQQYQPAPAPAPAPQPAATPQQPPPQQYQPAPQPQQYQPAPAPAPQPAAKPQQPPPQQYQPAPQPQQYQPAPAPAPAPQPAARPQQPPPAAPAPKPAAQPKQQNDWGTTDDWGSADW
ncbi:MAG: SPOR domain-containing protein [Chitinispirillales bacterium]|nr:SPOR domain-containing protein [Chitinispirillales bacterium]